MICLMVIAQVVLSFANRIYNLCAVAIFPCLLTALDEIIAQPSMTGNSVSASVTHWGQALGKLKQATGKQSHEKVEP